MTEYKSEDYLNNLKDILYKYPANLLPDNVKPKVDDQVRKLCDKKCNHNPVMDIYDLQLDAIKTIEEIMTSHLLGQSEVVIPSLVSEYTQLKMTLDYLNFENKRFKSVQDLNGRITVFKPKEMQKLLFDDLTQLCESYNLKLECPIAELVKI